MSVVYHYTDTARLPWILKAGELRPGRNKIGGYPDPDFIWATTSDQGDRTASASVKGLRDGLVRHVRFVLDERDFLTWPEAVARHPSWTAKHVDNLQRAAAGLSSPRDWRCRLEPLPVSECLTAETRSYVDPRWRAFDLTTSVMDVDEDTCGVWVEGQAYFSATVRLASGAVGYHAFHGQRRAA